MKFLIVGLGNPGAEYKNTRHNIGFDILRSISLEAECDFVSNKYGSLCKIKYKGKVLVLLLPNTFMNLSGKAVNYWLKAEKIEQLSWYNLQELLEDDNLTHKIIKSCVSLNSALTEIIKDEHPDMAKKFFETANYLYPFGILTLVKVKKINYKDAEKEYIKNIDEQTSDYMDYMKQNGVVNQSFIKGTFLGDDIAYCNEIRSAIEITLSETKNQQ